MSEQQEKRRLICAKCSLPLASGASHPTADNCVEALKAALDDSPYCTSCGGEMRCLGCAVKEKGLNMLKQGGWALLNHAMSEPKRRKKANGD